MESAKYDLLILAPQIGICGQNCKHCYVTHNITKHKPFKEVKDIIDRFAETLVQPAITERACFYTLDELTLYPRVIDLLAYSRERNVLPVPTLSTNGIGIATRNNWKEILEELKKSGVKGINMSFFGDENYHDWFTGREGSFQRSIEASRRADAHDFWVHWNLFLTKENVEQIVQLAKEKGDHRKTISIPQEVTKWQEWSHIHATMYDFSRIPKEYQEFIRTNFKSEADWIEMIQKGELKPHIQPSNENKNKVKVKSLTESGGVLYWGDVYPKFDVGHMKKNSLRELFACSEKPPGLIAEEQMDIFAMAREHGDPNSAKAYSLSQLKIKWLFESLQ